MDPTQETTEPTPDRLKALKQTMAGVYAESIAITGLPPDTLFNQVFIHAAIKSLKADGRMVAVGAGNVTFIPTKDTLRVWLDEYFGDLQGAHEHADEGMAEA